MALQLGATRRAFKEAGVSDEAADRAAEELAAYDRQFTDVRADISDLGATLRNEINTLGAALRSEIGDLRGEIKVLKWGQGVTFAAVLAILLKLFIH